MQRRIARECVPTTCSADHVRAQNPLVLSLSEGHRGEVAHVLLTDATGKLSRVKFKGPSFHNWQGLWLADFQAMDFGFPFLYSSQACRI